MLVIARHEIAARIGDAVVFGLGRVVTDVADAVEVRALAHRYQPQLLLLDLGMGEGYWDAHDAVARIALVRSRPPVVGVTDDDRADATSRAARAGCYDLVSLARPRWERSLAAAVAVALAAQRAATLRSPAPLLPVDASA